MFGGTKFYYMVCLIKELKDINTNTFDELQSSLIFHEQNVNQSSNVEEHALKASNFTRFSNVKGRERGRERDKSD